MTNTQSHAQVELDILSKSTPDAVILEFKDEILAICEKFGNSGQSGGSAPYVAGALSSAVKKLCMFQTIAPLTGIDDEWSDVSSYSPGETLYQNKRNAAVFKDNSGVWYLDAIVWCGDTPGESGNTWDTFSGTVQGIKSRQYIKEFPFEPKTFYIGVTREMLPIDWQEEPFFQDKDYYNISEYEATGVKNWIPGDKYRYVIKDIKQLDEVWKYYQDRSDELIHYKAEKPTIDNNHPKYQSVADQFKDNPRMSIDPITGDVTIK